MALTKIDLKNELKRYFGFDQFKGLQEDAIESIITDQHTFVIMPTGGGKSLCYQLPALIKEGTAIIISPLIALMKNQVDVLRSLSDNDGVAHVLNSSLNKTQVREVMSDIESGVTKLLYVAPESLIKEEYVEFLKKQNLSFLAIDEAHCISEWGHDFRPEYRNIRKIAQSIKPGIPIIALTATATPKVEEDIMKNLGIEDANVFKASFNRPNLYYEVRPKTSKVAADITKFVKRNSGKSGIVYCLSRRKVEELAKTLQVNGISAIPYHAGLDSKKRAKHQDMFLKEDVDVVVATIAFGMGIDKPDVRFVVHHDIPKSIESYYQETGRAGRDGGEGHCLAFYSYKDIEKLEKFMSGKPVAEQEIGHALLQEVVAYAETSISRRKFILHYFGEEFDEKTGEGADMDDNVRNPKKQHEAKEEVELLLKAVKETKQLYKTREIVNTLIGKSNALLNSHKTNKLDIFGQGDTKDRGYWMALVRQVVVAGLLRKDIETYGILRLTEKGEDFIENPESFMMTEDHTYEDEDLDGTGIGANAVADPKLMKMLKDLRKKVADQKDLPPFVVFQDPSLEDMALKYPITLDEMTNIQGVGEGKARKFGKPFLKLIEDYVEENDIIRPEDLIVKSTGANSSLKLFIIQSIDRKIPLEDIANSKGIEIDNLIQEMEAIVYSGTKLNIDYILEDVLDEYDQEDLYDYFMEADNDKIDEAMEEFEGDYDEDELHLYRMKFISEVAN
ncbi:MAG TPA: DNA helicase RecQ [Flavobacteriaceae bacterium]|nr:DNA helicase RecQ [Flavobacteriaceae bacterium]